LGHGGASGPALVECLKPRGALGEIRGPHSSRVRVSHAIARL
jgi:hypothetical protein